MPRRTDLTPEKKTRYLRAVEQLGTLTAGCRAAAVSHNTIYQWREHDDAFMLAEQQARTTFADELEHEVVTRGRAGSDTLLIFMLKAVRPEKFRDRVDVRQTVTSDSGDQLTDQQREAVRKALRG
jgi:predicted DNA binding protein